MGTDRGALVGKLAETFRIYALVALLALAVIGVVAWTTVGRMLQPIAVLEEATRRITETDLSERIPIQGHDDLARLSRTVNGMLDRLERAFDEQSRLLDDASHELRTPLAIMRTNLELIEPRDAVDVVRTQEVLLDEVSMMSRLVDDLVTLAKSDRPEFVQVSPVELAALTDTAFARAQSLPDREWSLESVADLRFVADSQRVTQAWLQLAANAHKFSDSGSTIHVGSAVTRRGIHLWVRDHGIGIAAEDQVKVLERFHRVDPEKDGAGLGLPIVCAIVAAHGGHVELDSQLGQGSTFTMVLPREGKGS